MSGLRILRAADYPRMPWKNGAGTTLEIIRDGGADLQDFSWRLSVADVGESGGFSAFNGYQRIISVLDGAGMQLTVDGQLSRPLRVLDAFAFSGDSQVECRLLDGAIRDFNLIYAPARCSARLQWLALTAQPQQVFSSAPVLLLFSAADGVRVQLSGEPRSELQRLDCLLLESSQPLLRELQIQADGAGHCALIELYPR